MTSRVGVMFHDCGRGSTRGNPVIELRCSLGHPACLVATQFYTTDGRIMPEEAIAATGEQEGDRHFSIALNQLDSAALLIQQAVLMLAKPIEALSGVGEEACFKMEQIAGSGFEGARRDTSGMNQSLLSQQFCPGICIGKTDEALRGDSGGNSAISDGCAFLANSDLRFCLYRRK